MCKSNGSFSKKTNNVLCYICMSQKHKALKYNANYICKKCSVRHHILICQKCNLKSTAGNSGSRNSSTNVQATLPATNQNQKQTIPYSYQQIQNNQTLINSANMVTNFPIIFTKTNCQC